jgi:hypothetical protein
LRFKRSIWAGDLHTTQFAATHRFLYFCQYFAKEYLSILTAAPKNEILVLCFRGHPGFGYPKKESERCHEQRKEGEIMKSFKIIFVFWALISTPLFISSTDVFGQTDSSDEVGRLIEDLSNESWQIRWDAAAALGETKDPRAIGPLSAALKDENSYVRMTAARSLGMMDDPRVILPLIEALKDDSHGVKKNAALSLKIRTGQDFGKDPEAWSKWWEENK